MACADVESVVELVSISPPSSSVRTPSSVMTPSLVDFSSSIDTPASETSLERLVAAVCHRSAGQYQFLGRIQLRLGMRTSCGCVRGQA